MQEIPHELVSLFEDLSHRETVSELPWRERDLRTGRRILGRLFPEIEQERGGYPINVIPPLGEPGPCRPIVLVSIGTRDGLERRILEAIEHVSAKCAGITRHVVFYAARWDHEVWARHAGSFRSLRVSSVTLKMPLSPPIRLI